MRAAAIAAALLAGGLSGGATDVVQALLSEDHKFTPVGAVKGEHFGAAVAANNERLVVSADRFGAGLAGYAEVFEPLAGSWIRSARLEAPDGHAYDTFGSAVAMDGDTIVVGAYEYIFGDQDGGAYVFVRGDAGWEFQQKLVPAVFRAREHVGVSVALAGDVAVVGATPEGLTDHEPRAYVFEREGGSWRQTARLDPDVTGGAGFFFWPVAISDDGDTIVVGAPFDDDLAFDAGAAYVYSREPDGWARETKILPTAGTRRDLFGIDVAIDGDVIAVMSPSHRVAADVLGAVYLYGKEGGAWTEQELLHAGPGTVSTGWAVDVDAERVLFAASFGEPFQGLVAVKDGDSWELLETLLASDGGSGDAFGFFSLSLSGSRALVGARSDNEDRGAAYLFENVPGLVRVEGFMAIDPSPECLPTLAGCGEAVPGVSDVTISSPDAPPTFRVPLVDFNGHLDRTCADDECRYWLKLRMAARGVVLSTTPDGETTTVAYARWRDADGAWMPAEGIPVRATFDREAASEGEGLVLPESLQLPAAAFEDAVDDGFLRIRVEAAPNEWHPSTPNWALTVGAAQVQLVAPPVVIVHGWALDNEVEDYAAQAPPGWESELETALGDIAREELGQDPWAWGGDEAIHTFAYHNKQDVRLSGRGGENDPLFRAIRSSRDATSYDGPVDLVSFSMGGLVSRWLAEQVVHPEGINPIRKLVTLGTPHLGSALADWKVEETDRDSILDGAAGADRFYLNERGLNLGTHVAANCRDNGVIIWCEDEVEWPANWDELGVFRNPAAARDGEFPETNFMADFELKAYANPVLDALNDRVGAPGVDYFLIAGQSNKGTQLGGWLKGWVEGGAPTQGKGDIVVSTRSATLGFNANFCHTTLSIGGDHHLSLPENRAVRNAAFLSLAGVDGRVCDAVESVEEGQPLSSAGTRTFWLAPAGNRPAGGAPSPVTSQVHVPQPSPPVASARWLITASDHALISLLAPSETLADVNLRLFAPDGSASTPEDPGSNVLWLVSPGPLGDQAFVGIDEPADGEWTMEVTGALPTLSMFRGTVNLDSALRVESRSDEPSFVGAPVILRAAFNHGDEPVLDADVKGSVRELALNLTVVLPFRDDGLAPDEVADDAVYAALYVPVTPGSHRLIIEGESAGRVRVFETLLPVRATPALPARSCGGAVGPVEPEPIINGLLSSKECPAAP